MGVTASVKNVRIINVPFCEQLIQVKSPVGRHVFTQLLFFDAQIDEIFQKCNMNETINVINIRACLVHILFNYLHKFLISKNGMFYISLHFCILLFNINVKG